METLADRVFEVFDAYFRLLDEAPVTATGFFVSEDDKERYETRFMYAFRKHEAALYHYGNVLRFLREDSESANSARMLPVTDSRIAKKVMRRSTSANHYVHELWAFLAALKSALDFLASASYRHLGGKHGDSIGHLLRLVNRGGTGPILDQVRSHQAWLEGIRFYRDHVVHRQITGVTSGYEVHEIGDVSTNAMYPVVIPRSPDMDLMDTRRAMMLEDGPRGLFSFESEAWSESAGGTKRLVEHRIEYTPAPGYIYIEEFMRCHLDAFYAFLADMIQGLTALEFKAAYEKHGTWP